VDALLASYIHHALRFAQGRATLALLLFRQSLVFSVAESRREKRRVDAAAKRTHAPLSSYFCIRVPLCEAAKMLESPCMRSVDMI